MKQLLALLMIIYCNINYAQWIPSFKLSAGQSFAAISAPADNTIWTITNSFILYNSEDGGKTWRKIHPKGLAQDISVQQLYAIDNTVAFLTVITDFTGVGPGIVYRTTDGGRSWTKVFSHPGNCDIKMGMFDNKTGLLSCSFSSFDGSVKSGQQLYFTINGGKHWRVHPFNPSNDYYIVSFTTKGSKVAMSDFEHVYFSNNRGLKWTRSKQKAQDARDLQFEDSSYAIANSGSLINLVVKRPGIGWISEGDVAGIGGAVTGLVLDGGECWFGLAFDTRNNYYSPDSAKTFTPFIVDSTGGFVLMTKARNGSMLIGATPFFASSTLWINKRENKDTKELIIVIASETMNTTNQFAKPMWNSSSAGLEQNIPNPFHETTVIRYHLPQQYVAATIVITDMKGTKVKVLPVSGKGNGSVNIDASTLSRGIYHYSLIVDSKLISTKQLGYVFKCMMLADCV